MEYGLVSLEKRLKDNIRNYSLTNLFIKMSLMEYLEQVAAVTNTAILMTERHGEPFVQIGESFLPHFDVTEQPGRKIKVAGRTVGHLYVEKEDLAPKLFEKLCEQLMEQGEQSYRVKEMTRYLEEQELQSSRDYYDLKYAEREDVLTGTLNAAYFKNRQQIINRSEILPVAVIVGNINDWKYVNDHFGEEESDRLIKVIATILKEESKQEYLIGRVDGDVFHILMPMAEEEEAREYCNRVQERCNTLEDNILAPSIAFGILHKTNVEENLKELLSDAEYEMFQNKMELKNTTGYQKRLKKG